MNNGVVGNGKEVVPSEWRVACREIGAGTAAIFCQPAPEKSTPNEDAAAVIPVNAGKQMAKTRMNGSASVIVDE